MITDDVAPLRFDVEPWFMSGFDFRCMWEALGLDHLPFPLAYRNPQQYMADVEADRRVALSRQRADLNQNRIRILEALRFPAFMVQGFGRVDEGAGERLYRMFAVVGTTGYCAVITQDPSERTIFGDSIQIIGCVNVDFPQVVAEALPEYTPGTRPKRDGRLEDETPAAFFWGEKIVDSVLLTASAEFTLDYELRNASYLTLVNVADDGAYLVLEDAGDFRIVAATAGNVLDAFKKVETAQLNALQRMSPAGSSEDADVLP